MAKTAVKKAAAVRKATGQGTAVAKKSSGDAGTKQASGKASPKNVSRATVRSKQPAKAAAQNRLSAKPAKQVPAKKVRAAQAVPAGLTAVDAQTLAHGLNSLLHTMQVVQQHEERLCSLMHALRRGRPSRPLLSELREVLGQLPAHDYLYEVDALLDAVAA